MLRSRGLDWVEDPSNANPATLRARLRRLRMDADDTTRALVGAAQARGRVRAASQAMWQAELARAAVDPQGFAVLPSEGVGTAALAHLLAMIAGSRLLPPLRQLEGLARSLRPATIAGVRILPAGRLGPGWLLVREAAAMQPDIAACAGALWDGRFRLIASQDGLTLGAWGKDASSDRHGPPFAVAQTLPVLRAGADVVVSPRELFDASPPLIIYAPHRPATSAPSFALPGPDG
jgi:tRNA(Ile)-lysidine synthase